MLALYKEDILLFENSKAKIITPGTNGAMLRVQAVTQNSASNIQYEVVGRLHKLAKFQPLVGIFESDGTYQNTMNGTGVYTFDISGYKEISVRIQATIGDPSKMFIAATICRDI